MAEEQAGRGVDCGRHGRLVTWLASAQREAWGVEGGVGWDGTTAQRVSGGSGQRAGGRRPSAGKRRGRGADWLASVQREARGAGGWGTVDGILLCTRAR